MPTRNDVARLAGVSPSTVTRALNGHPSISEETVRKVLESARRLDYIPSRLGRGHFQQKSFQIGLVIPFRNEEGRLRSVPEEYFTRSLYGMAQEARKSDYSVSIITDGGLSAEHLEREVRSRRVDGLIFLGTNRGDRRFAQLHRRKIPLVLVHNRDEREDVPFVDTDSRPGLEELFSLLEKRGVRSIGILNGGDDFFNALERKRLIEELAEDKNIRIALAREGNFSRSGGRQAAADFLASPLPEVIISANDRMAFGLVEGLQRRGVRIGGDVGVVGFDNLHLSTLMTPPLTTVHNPFFRVGKGAARLLLAKIEGTEEKNLIFPTHLIIRESFR